MPKRWQEYPDNQLGLYAESPLESQAPSVGGTAPLAATAKPAGEAALGGTDELIAPAAVEKEAEQPVTQLAPAAQAHAAQAMEFAGHMATQAALAAEATQPGLVATQTTLAGEATQLALVATQASQAAEAKQPDVATQATQATQAAEAKQPDVATQATQAAEATQPDVATQATHAAEATQPDVAPQATQATEAKPLPEAAAQQLATQSAEQKADVATATPPMAVSPTAVPGGPPDRTLELNGLQALMKNQKNREALQEQMAKQHAQQVKSQQPNVPKAAVPSTAVPPTAGTAHGGGPDRTLELNGLQALMKNQERREALQEQLALQNAQQFRAQHPVINTPKVEVNWTTHKREGMRLKRLMEESGEGAKFPHMQRLWSSGPAVSGFWITCHYFYFF